MDPKVAYVGAPLEMDLKGVLQIPVLRIVYRGLSKIKSIEGAIVFTSRRGIIALKMSNVPIKGNRIYCIGGQTSEHLWKLYSLKCIVPETQNTAGLADLLIGAETSINLVGSDQVSQKFLTKLREARIEVHRTIAYGIEENDDVDYRALEGVTEILVGSSKSFEILYERAKTILEGKKLYAIGKPTEETMKRLGYEPVESFENPDIAGILERLTTKR